jgi:hypothetical protein
VRRSRRGLSRSPRRRGVPTLIAGLASLALLCAAPAAVAQPGFCREDYSRDYAEPLHGMPGQHPPPEAELPFGPRNLSIFRPERTPVVLAGSNLGYRFASKNGGYRRLDLDWVVEIRLAAVDPDGRVRRVLAREQRRIGTIENLDPLDLTFPAPRPGYFRTELRVRSLRTGKSVAYKEYWRVLKRSVDIRIALSSTSPRRGETVLGRVENAGASNATAPVALALERYEGGAWLSVPQPPTPDSVMGTSWWLGPGENGTCHRYEIPADAVPGLYRFTNSVYAVQLQRRVTVTARFEVLP